MRQLVERVGDEAQPGTTDARAGELREQPHDLGVERRAALARIGLVDRDAPAEQDARPSGDGR